MASKLAGGRLGSRVLVGPFVWITYNTICGAVFFCFIATDYPYFFGIIDLSDSSRPIDWTTNNTIPEDL